MSKHSLRSSVFFTTLIVFVLFSSAVMGQGVTQVYSETFFGTSLPAGWRSVADFNHEWKVVQGVKSREGTNEGATMNITKSTLASLNVWAFTPPVRLFPGADYTIRFYHKHNETGTIPLKLYLNTVQDYADAFVIDSPTLVYKSGWQEYTYTFTVDSENNYYLGFGIATGIIEISIMDFSIDDLSITTPTVTRFYNKASADPALPVSWGALPDGSGIQPASMTEPDQVFNLVNYAGGSTIKLSRDMALTGTGSKLIVGDGVAPVTLELSEGRSVTSGTVETANYATIHLDAPESPFFGQTGLLSTIVLGRNAPAEIAGNAVFGTLVFDTGKQNRLNRNFKVKGKLELRDGRLELGDYDLELDYGASLVSRSAGSIIVMNGKGRLRKGIRAGNDVTLPVGRQRGDGTISYSPVKIKLANGSADDVFSVSVLEGVYSRYTDDVPDENTAVLSKAVNKTWIVSEDVPGGSDVILTLTWAEDDALPGFDPANSHIKHYENGKWDKIASAAAQPATMTIDGQTKTYYTMSRSGITSFSPYTQANEDSDDVMAPQGTLPVTLMHFKARAAANSTVKLTWATATESNNRFFVLERSADGLSFSEFARVEGAGTSIIRNDYTFTDHSPLIGTSYYRLCQVDTDGSVTYLPLIAVTRNEKQQLAINLHPNPAHGNSVNLQLQGLPLNQEVQVLVRNMLGNVVLQQRSLKPVNVLKTEDLLPGTYLVTVIVQAGSRTERLIVL